MFARVIAAKVMELASLGRLRSRRSSSSVWLCPPLCAGSGGVSCEPFGRRLCDSLVYLAAGVWRCFDVAMGNLDGRAYDSSSRRLSLLRSGVDYDLPRPGSRHHRNAENGN